MPRLIYALLSLICALAVSACASVNSNRVSVEYYSITGDSTADLDQQIKQKGPRINGGRHAVAVARIKIHPDVDFQTIKSGATSSLCKVGKVKVNVDAKVTLPRWEGRARANKKLGQAWDNIDKYTRLHEGVHVKIAFEYAKRMENELAALKTPINCTLLRLKSREIVQKHLDAHDAAQKKFDADEQKRFAEFARRQDKKS